MTGNNQIEIFKTPKGDITFHVNPTEDTIWASQAQIAQLFDTTKQNISLHVNNCFRDGELDQNSVVKEFLTTAADGKNYKTKMYNLDAIISVGYRVNSKKATDFRIWATKVLHNYLVSGVAVNERRLKSLDSEKLREVEGMMSVVRRLIARQALDAGEANGVLEVISKYSTSFQTLKQYDDGYIDLRSLNGPEKKQKRLTPELCTEVISELRRSLDAGELFGQPRGDAFSGSLNAIYQSYAGEDLYPTVSEKAAHLLYFIIKDHPFSDGNKRIGSLLFIVFLTLNNQHLTKNGETKITDRALTALALLIAESNPSEKDLITALIRKLLED